MNISFLKDNPLSCLIVNSADGRPLYDVDTPWKLSGRTTTIRRTAGSDTPSDQEQIIAEIHWHNWSPTKITFLGTEMDMKEFLRKSGGIMSQSKILTGNDGQLYKWKHSASDKLSLVDCQTKVIVAQSHNKKIGLFSPPRKMNIDILPQGMPNIDAIVVSFIVMEEKKREAAAGVGAAEYE